MDKNPPNIPPGLDILKITRRAAKRYYPENYTEAEELAADALRKAINSWSTFNPAKSKLSTWLNRVVLNMFKDRLRASVARRSGLQVNEDILENLIARADAAKVQLGRPPVITEEQASQLVATAQRLGLGCKSMARYLRENADVLKSHGLSRAPSWGTIRNAMQGRHCSMI